MPNPIIMPKFGQMTEDSAIVEWLKKEGDPVAKGDILFTVETDKSVMEVESFFDGTLLKVLVKEGISVPVQTTVAFVGQPGEEIPDVAPPQPAAKPAAPAKVEAKPQKPAPSAAPAPTAAAAAITTVAAPAVAAAPAPSPAPMFRISPRARTLARRSVIDPTSISGSGPNGRVIEKDVAAYLDQHGYHQLRIAPAAKNLAIQEEIDLLSVAPGDGGRIAVADVERAVSEKPRPMSRMRQIIGQRLTESIVTQPHFYVTVSVDMTDLIAYRSGLKAAGEPYTVTDFIAQAVILSLVEFPGVNSSTDGKTTRWHSHVNLGLAVSIDGGLVVPVIQGAEELTLREICEQAKDLAGRARGGRLAPDQMSGGTFTISNMGMLDVDEFHAIINTGEGGILAVASTRPEPVVRDNKIVIRQMMKITLSADHRLVDGALGAQFINSIKQKLEDIELWKRLTS